MAIPIEKNILRLQVPINDIKTMQIFQGKYQLSRIELALNFREINFLNQMMAQVLSTAIIQTEVNIIGSLKGKMKTYHKGVIYLF